MARKFERRSGAMLDYAVNERRGRDFGLDAPADRRVVEVPVERIVPNPHQPRRSFDPQDMEALKSSIERHGLVQPVGVKPLDDGRFQLVYGERRYRAVRELGHATILGLTLDGDADEIAIIENLQRVDLNPFEEADAYVGLIERHTYSHAQVAEVVGTNKTRVTRTLAIGRLPDLIRAEYDTVRPTWKQLVAIAGLPDAGAQLAAWQTVKAPSDASVEPVVPAVAAPGTVVSGSRMSEPAGPSAFSPHAVKQLSRALSVLLALGGKPVPLADADRVLLEHMREAIDGLLAEGVE